MKTYIIEAVISTVRKFPIMANNKKEAEDITVDKIKQLYQSRLDPTEKLVSYYCKTIKEA